jgi:hypothetical protein
VFVVAPPPPVHHPVNLLVYSVFRNYGYGRTKKYEVVQIIEKYPYLYDYSIPDNKKKDDYEKAFSRVTEEGFL